MSSDDLQSDTPRQKPFITKSRLNFTVDLLAFVAFLLITTTGFLMRWTLPPGSGGRHGGGLAVWGLDRHGWGGVHFWLAVALLVFMALHILLHWRWILRMVGGSKSDEQSGLRLALGTVALITLIVVGLLPVISDPVSRPGGHDRHEGEARGGGQGQDGGGQGHSPGGQVLRGRNTVAEAAEYAGMTVPELLDRLGLPPDTEPDQRLGQIIHAHGLSMDDVRKLGPAQP